MTFEQMRIFLEAAHFGSFTHAASDWASPNQRSAFHQEARGETWRLAIRSFGRRLMLTEAGQVLLSEAERILRDVELTIRRVESRRPAAPSSLVACTQRL